MFEFNQLIVSEVQKFDYVEFDGCDLCSCKFLSRQNGKFDFDFDFNE